MPSIPNVTYSDPNTATGQPAGNSKLGKDEFLNLLVTQLRYQDPMEPMKDTDFVAQLAQFSSLEQLSSINTSLDSSTQLNYVLSQTIANTMATTLIGKQIIAAGDQIGHSYNESDTLNFDLSSNAKTAEINIYDDAGTLVRTITREDLDKGMNSCTWDGKDNSGANLAAGNYTFKVTAKDDTGKDIAVETRRIGIVESIRYEDGQGFLIVDGQKVSLSDIIEVVQPGQSGGRTYHNG
jgi:flagellar basal-body rod modification protein FlgD